MSGTTELERFERANAYEHELFDEKKTQVEMTLEYLEKYGEITPLEALTAYGCFRLGARIADLRADGHNIVTEINKGKKNYAIYRLEGNDGKQ